MNVRPGGLPSLSRTGLGMWHRLVWVWTLGATDTENLVDPFVHLAIIYDMGGAYLTSRGFR